MNPGQLGPEPAGIVQLEQLFNRIVFLSVGMAFVALTILLVFAAFKFLTSGGDKKILQQSWGIITWAFLGIFFLGLAWVAILLIQSFTGVTLTQFSLQWPGN
jgi:hypothetical protein